VAFFSFGLALFDNIRILLPESEAFGLPNRGAKNPKIGEIPSQNPF
jgi:hypothetical protein